MEGLLRSSPFLSFPFPSVPYCSVPSLSLKSCPPFPSHYFPCVLVPLLSFPFHSFPFLSSCLSVCLSAFLSFCLSGLFVGVVPLGCAQGLGSFAEGPAECPVPGSELLWTPVIMLESWLNFCFGLECLLVAGIIRIPSRIFRGRVAPIRGLCCSCILLGLVRCGGRCQLKFEDFRKGSQS